VGTTGFAVCAIKDQNRDGARDERRLRGVWIPARLARVALRKMFLDGRDKAFGESARLVCVKRRGQPFF
jgi:hypothetical protein